MLNKSLILQQTSLQEGNVGYQPPGRGPHSQINMGRLLIDELQQAASLVDFKEMLNRSAALTKFAKQLPTSAILLNDLKAMVKGDTLHCLLAIETLAVIEDERANALLVECLAHTDASVRRQVTWKLSERNPVAPALPQLVQQLCLGGIDTMHAHQTLNHWAKSEPEIIFTTINNALTVHSDALKRARLVDLLGTLGGTKVSAILARLAADHNETVSVRLAAISAMGSRIGPFDDLLRQLKHQDSDIGSYASLALNDQKMLHSSALPRPTGGLRVCQLVLANVDKTLSAGGCGETGGVASLLVSLGDALARQPSIDQVLTLGLGSVEDAVNDLSGPINTPQPYRIITAGDDMRPMNSTNAWEHLPVLQRSIQRCIGHFGGIDLIHLRMLDAATFAAADVARNMAIPICFSFAPDPQNTVHALHARGQISRSEFVDADAQSNLWFRARMLEQMGRSVSHVALFPQPKCKLLLQDIRKDLRHHKQQSVTIAEGIDIQLIRQAAEQYAETKPHETKGVIADLAQNIAVSRRHLPLLLSVGRFHPVKGMDRIAAAWAADPRLYNTCNLVMVGGNLNHPSAVEKTVMEAIDSAIPVSDHRRAGVILMGGRPRADIAQLMVATMLGCADFWAPGGIYVDGARKEEFGLALIEALATGLVVVAPSTGGPSTYVDNDHTGILVDPEQDLGQAIHRGFALVEHAGRRLTAQNMVAQHYAIDTMAEKLASLYQTVRDKP